MVRITGKLVSYMPYMFGLHEYDVTCTYILLYPVPGIILRPASDATQQIRMRFDIFVPFRRLCFSLIFFQVTLCSHDRQSYLYPARGSESTSISGTMVSSYIHPPITPLNLVETPSIYSCWCTHLWLFESLHTFTLHRNTALRYSVHVVTELGLGADCRFHQSGHR